MEEKKRLILAIIFCSIFFLVELLGGIWSNSLALLSDSFHMLTDVLSFVISLSAIYIATRKPCKRYNFGWGRIEVLGALLSIVLIYICTGWLVIEAINRISKPEFVDGRNMFGVALSGVIFNIVLMFTFHHHGHGHGHHHGHHHEHAHDHEQGHTHSDDSNEHMEHKHSLNIRAAILHVIGDLLASIGVLVASIFIMVDQLNTGSRTDSKYLIMDPICTFVFSVIVLGTTLPLLKECIMVLMETNPNMNTLDVVDELERDLGITVLDFKSWLISITTPYCLLIIDAPRLESRPDTAQQSPTAVTSDTSSVDPQRDCSSRQGLLSSVELLRGVKLTNRELISEIKQTMNSRYDIPVENCYVIIN